MSYARGCYMDATRKLLLWNLNLTWSELEAWPRTVIAQSVPEDGDAGIIGVLVDAHDEHGCVSRRRGNNDLLAAAVDVQLCLLQRRKHSSRLNHVLDARLTPRDLRRFLPSVTVTLSKVLLTPEFLSKVSFESLKPRYCLCVHVARCTWRCVPKSTFKSEFREIKHVHFPKIYLWNSFSFKSGPFTLESFLQTFCWK